MRNLLTFIVGLIGGALASAFTALGPLLAEDVYPWARERLLGDETVEYRIDPADTKHCKKPPVACFPEDQGKCAEPALESIDLGGLYFASGEADMGVTRVVCEFPGAISWGVLDTGGAEVKAGPGVSRVVGRIGVRTQQSPLDWKISGFLPSEIIDPVEFAFPAGAPYPSRRVELKVPNGGLDRVVVFIELVDAWRNTGVEIDLQPVTLRVRP